MDHKTYTVSGMTCGHCVLSVREEVAAIDGVQSVDVDLASGQLSVRSDRIDEAAVADAVAEAGYELVR
jgi:copper chaperone